MTIWRALKKGGVPLRRKPAPRRRASPEELEEARRLYLAGWAAVQLGEALLLGRGAIRDALTRAGLDLPPEGEPPPRSSRRPRRA